jgi:hypothetical protein
MLPEGNIAGYEPIESLKNFEMLCDATFRPHLATPLFAWSHAGYSQMRILFRGHYQIVKDQLSRLWLWLSFAEGSMPKRDT